MYTLLHSFHEGLVPRAALQSNAGSFKYLIVGVSRDPWSYLICLPAQCGRIKTRYIQMIPYMYTKHMHVRICLFKHRGQRSSPSLVAIHDDATDMHHS